MLGPAERSIRPSRARRVGRRPHFGMPTGTYFRLVASRDDGSGKGAHLEKTLTLCKYPPSVDCAMSHP